MFLGLVLMMFLLVLLGALVALGVNWLLWWLLQKYIPSLRRWSALRMALVCLLLTLIAAPFMGYWLHAKTAVFAWIWLVNLSWNLILVPIAYWCRTKP